jgi:catechol 2,3-dioxygenase-like lactoylglutathione lyase family enzyme
VAGSGPPGDTAGSIPTALGGGCLRVFVIAIADVAVVVSSAKKSAKWWVKNLGFDTYTIGGSGHAVLIAPPGDRFVLHLCEGFAPLEPGDTGIAFVTDGMDATVARMTKGGVRFPVPPKKEPWGTMAKFADPDGNIFWLLEVPTSMVRATLSLRAPKRKRASARSRARARKR